MKEEKRIEKYLNNCEKETLIQLYLQMRFERDLYSDLYEKERIKAKGKEKGWDLTDSKVAYGYGIGYEDAVAERSEEE